VTKQYVYLNNAAVGPLPERVLNAVIRTSMEKYYGETYWSDWEDEAEETRRIIARFINASPEEIALVPNTSEGIGIVANGIRWQRGDNIVTTDMEFPSNLFPWQVQARRRGIELRIVANRDGELLTEDFEGRIDRETRIVAVSHVQFSNGFKVDLKELSKIAHENGAYLVTDAVQSVGQTPVDVRDLEVDFLASSGYKWLLSPIATGFLYVKRPLIEELEPSIVGYRSAERMHEYSFREFKPASTARRFEHGQINFPGFSGMREALLLLEEVGLHRIERIIRKLSNQIIEGVESMSEVRMNSAFGEEYRSGIMKLGCERTEIVAEKLRREGVIVSVREGGLRVSPHFYNTQGEIERFLDALRDAASN